MAGTEQKQSETRRVIVLRDKKPEVWLSGEGTLHALPELEIPQGQRITEHIAIAVRENLGIAAVSIAALRAPEGKSCGASIRYNIMESCAPGCESLDAKNWVPLDLLEPRSFRDVNDFAAIREAVAQLRNNQDKGPFGKQGWFECLRQWVQEAIEPHGLRLRGPFRQLNASAAFSLICFQTNGPPVWFKATGAPNFHEFRLTLALSHLFSRSLPHIIDTRPEWNGWLALNADGIRLNQVPEPNAWTAAAGDLADLQIASLGKSLLLLEAGARDLRSAALRNRIEPFFQTMGSLMERQTNVPPAVLSRMALRTLSTQVSEALDALDETAIPTALGHLDLNPGNIVCSPNSAVFLDWAEGFVGHPFLTFEYHLEYFRRAFGIGHAEEAQMVDRYSARWRALLSDTVIRRALEGAPLVAAFAYATGNELWKTPGEIEKPRTAAYLRGLTRRMHREAQFLADRRRSCLR